MLEITRDHRLPPLAWVAFLRRGRREITARCGSLAEIGDGWLCEAAWAGAYEAGGFDLTPLVFGSGVRERGDHACFVSPGSTVDRLWTWTDEAGHARWVSNSLVQLLAAADARPLRDYGRYRQDLESIVDGLAEYRRTIPVDRGRVEVVYFENLAWDGNELSRVPKPRIERSFSSFGSYRSFLSETSRALAENAFSSARQHAVEPLTSVSAGYDSPAASVLAREIGCDRGVTIHQARSPIPGRSDSGRAIGEALGLEMRTYDRDLAIGSSELRFWAAKGHAHDVNLGIFDYPEPVCLFFTGFHGDKMWTTESHDTSERIVRGDTSGLGFTEERLHRGVLHCPVPFWGVRKMDEIARITRSEEMRPWRLDRAYDRPVPRRIVEEAGVPRDAFGRRKSATTSQGRPIPHTPELADDFADYVEASGASVRPLLLTSLRASVQWYLDSFQQKWPVLRDRLPSVGPDVPALQFQWAIDRLIDTLSDGEQPDVPLGSSRGRRG